MNSGTTLGERLELLIDEMGLEQQEVAEQLGFKTSTFNGYVTNKREPSFEKLKRFAEYFGVSIDYLLGYSPIKDPYMRHLPEEINAFVSDPANIIYLELAMNIKARTETGANQRQEQAKGDTSKFRVPQIVRQNTAREKYAEGQ